MKRVAINRRWAVLLTLLGVSVAAAVAVSRESSGGGVVAVAERSSSRTATTAASVAAERRREAPLFQVAEGELVAHLNMRRINEDVEPLFPVVRKAAPTPRAAVEEAPAEPVAPPLPFRFLGQMIEDGRPTLFLSLNDRNIAVKAGEMIDDTYRVDSITNGVVEFTYLPLKQKQTLPIGERS